MNLSRSFLFPVSAALLLAGCGTTAIVSTPIENIDAVPLKVADLNNDEFKAWPHADLIADTIPGMSVNKAYEELLKGRKGVKVVVGVVDSGVDIEHEDLKDVLWTNEKEIPDNGIDDDGNGYVDDVHGWNFLGDALHENLEYVRVLKKGDDGSETYKKAKAEYEKEYQEAQLNKTQYEQILQMVKNADATVQEELGKEDYTREDLEGLPSSDLKLLQARGVLTNVLSIDPSLSTVAEVKEELKEGVEYFSDQLNYNLNLDFDGRGLVGDDPDDINDTDYGNNNVTGPDKEEAKHGTHVSGIIAASRNNGKGMNGVANNVEIMAVRAVPDGDEYDKDIALAIRYAVDNGAKVINTSFGKYYSPHPEWVRDAIKYAAENDVLIVNAAGNESKDLDKTNVYPNDAVDNGKEISDNFLTVGALDYTYGPEMIAKFSNYGKNNVDVFAPGTKIWSTIPDNKYKFEQGTSMASPEVAGVAALIRSYYPDLSASQVKKIIMHSGLAARTNVILEGNPEKKKPFTEISRSGRMVNAYNAIIMADKVSRKKLDL
ncbi:S8 family peptidase [Sinomicrobium weinanense]|uniref:S8 family peptidase n=1 Tax=Sinomicrobium weinanense TaxID=2842200 RepID=A0A926Q266_9FLAO|nr:S8 family peptidase [Sinomicrobium weinanense]MBC9794591.1 S8 family peptidase [Sinomicrobium weinanense]MBU3124076.1 S8 family peptidase [Sinomicrobium weinanense]